ncbi:MAG: DNA polymerase III subunit delta' [Ignavibacteriales bacterium]|nr:DNA polymerase III subunit delta' [Ignavibacteriales bacterium]
MGWNRVIGQKQVKELLRRAIGAGQVAHAYCFYGEEGVGKDALAIEFARALNCERQGTDSCGECSSCRKIEVLQHPQVRFVIALPSGKGEKTGDEPIKGFTEDQVSALQAEMATKARDPYHRISLSNANFIKVNSIREIRRQAALTPFQKGKKVFIVSNAEAMNLEASNSLLKTLEEPPADTVIMLTTSRKEQLLSTIVSRCQQIRCGPLSEDEMTEALKTRDGVAEAEARLAASLANGSFTAARALASEDMSEMLQQVVHFLRLVLGTSSVALLDGVEHILSSMERAEASRWLRLVQVWLHQALAVRERHGANSEKDLENFIRKFPHADLLRAADAVERSIALVEKNVYLPLIFITLAVELKACIHGKPPATVDSGLPS